MESTGSYWKPVFNILEGSLKIVLANPEQVKALRGQGGFALLGNSCEMNSFVQDCGHGQDFPV